MLVPTNERTSIFLQFCHDVIARVIVQGLRWGRTITQVDASPSISRPDFDVKVEKKKRGGGGGGKRVIDALASMKLFFPLLAMEINPRQLRVSISPISNVFERLTSLFLQNFFHDEKPSNKTRPDLIHPVGG